MPEGLSRRGGRSAPGGAQISLAGLRAGDAAAQARFWEEHRARVFRHCARVLGAGRDAEELAQDVLSEFIFERAARLARDEAALAYLRLMAVRRALRHRDRQRRLHGREMAEQEDPDAAAAVFRAGDAAALRRLPDCLERLTPKAREALLLRYRRELTTARIGEIVGGSKQYIGRLLRQSLARLRDCLERRGETS